MEPLIIPGMRAPKERALNPSLNPALLAAPFRCTHRDVFSSLPGVHSHRVKSCYECPRLCINRTFLDC